MPTARKIVWQGVFLVVEEVAAPCVMWNGVKYRKSHVNSGEITSGNVAMGLDRDNRQCSCLKGNKTGVALVSKIAILSSRTKQSQQLENQKSR